MTRQSKPIYLHFFLCFIFLFAANTFASDEDFLWVIEPNWAKPTVSDQGVIYTRASYGNASTGSLKASNGDGSLKWHIEWPGYTFLGMYVVAPDSTVVSLSERNDSGRMALNTVSPDGKLNWVYELSSELKSNAGTSKLVVAADGTIYVTAHESLYKSQLFAIDKWGKLKWKKSFEHKIHGSPTIARDGTIYVYTYIDFYAFNPDGSLKWSLDIEKGQLANLELAIGENDVIYAPVFYGGVIAISADGEVLWTHNTSEIAETGTVIGINQEVYMLTRSINTVRLISISKSGELLWEKLLNIDYATSLMIARTGDIVVTGWRKTTSAPNDDQGWIFVVDQQRHLKWEKSLQHQVLDATFTLEGKLLVKSGASSYAFDSDLGGLALSYWPKARSGINNNGVLGDKDNDGVIDQLDAFPSDSSETLDSDWDGIGNNQDEDDDGDGFKDTNDAFPLDPKEWLDTDGDGIGNNTDQDDDGDGIADDQDIAPLDPYIGTSSSPGTLKLKHTINQGQELLRSAVTGYSTMYTVDTDGTLYSLSSSAQLNWKYELNSRVIASPVAGSEGTVYVATMDKQLYAISRSGELKWKFATQARNLLSPALDKSGNVYLASGDEYLYALNPTGELLWKHRFGTFSAAPSIADDGTIYLATADKLLSLSPGGDVNWEHSIPNYPSTSIAINEDKTLYVGLSDGKLLALSPAGKAEWALDTNSQLSTAPVIDGEGNVYALLESGTLLALSNKGRLKWRYESGMTGKGSLLLAKDDTILFSVEGGGFAVLSEGKLLWEYQTGSAQLKLNLDDDGTLVASSQEGQIFLIHTETGGLAETPWPIQGKNTQNSSGPMLEHQANVDFDGDGVSDVLYRDRESLQWRIDLLSANGIKQSVRPGFMTSCCGWLFSGVGDFDGNGKHDVLLRNARSGLWHIYYLDGTGLNNNDNISLDSGTEFFAQAITDFNGDGKGDVLLRHETSGEWQLNLIDGKAVKDVVKLPITNSRNWLLVDAKDFDGNGSPDVLLRNQASGAWYIQLYSGIRVIQQAYVETLPSELSLRVKGVADYNGDGILDILLRDQDNLSWSIAEMHGKTATLRSADFLPAQAEWLMNSTGDYNADGKGDITLRHKDNNAIKILYLDTDKVISEKILSVEVTPTLEVQTLTAKGFH